MDGLLFYDAGAGQGEFYLTDGQGGIARTRMHTGWRSSLAYSQFRVGQELQQDSVPFSRTHDPAVHAKLRDLVARDPAPWIRDAARTRLRELNIHTP